MEINHNLFLNRLKIYFEASVELDETKHQTYLIIANMLLLLSLSLYEMETHFTAKF